MSEYWKSTPKYWCKHCSTYVRDTPLERKNHDATPKHQGNLKRFLRDLHKNHEKDEREKQRAKAEVARLNGVVAGAGSGSSTTASSSHSFSPASRQPATSAQIIQQREQLSELGVAIPDEFRREMAMVGDWQVTSERVIESEDREKKPDAIGFGIRKRPAEDEEEEEAIEVKKARWGSAYRTHPVGDDEDDLDALLDEATRKGKEPAVKADPEAAIKAEADSEEQIKAEDDTKKLSDIPQVGNADERVESDQPEAALSADLAASDAKHNLREVVFKKRKAKNIRRK
ncbi:hypothetical protein BP5796_07948 [Coleophoma crateriformis]|uniref:U1-type domain-containing protein n=1 Tax=Coleophoma crateriformis TaxID=565419 RepID=A0A3D8RDG4_9HELO|nr:hypothetical protein BP5796_07948 [Coleophoma crateriformis]